MREAVLIDAICFSFDVIGVNLDESNLFNEEFLQKLMWTDVWNCLEYNIDVGKVPKVEKDQLVWDIYNAKLVQLSK